MKADSRNSKGNLNRRGLDLPGQTLERLARTGIYAQTSVTLEHQGRARRYVVRGVESGGAVEEAGHYVTFAGERGERLHWLQPLDSLTANGIHALAVAPVLLRIEAVRLGHLYELRITRHRPGQAEGKRPPLGADTVYYGRQGYLELELWGANRDLAGAVLPKFYTRAGEEDPIPKAFRAAVQAAVCGVNCIGCTHAHFLTRRPRAEDDAIEAAARSESAEDAGTPAAAAEHPPLVN